MHSRRVAVMLARRHHHINQVIALRDRPAGYVRLKVQHVLPALQRAIQKANEGSYGICDDCGDPIDIRRLRAAQGATRCVSCQKEHERTIRYARGRRV